MRRLVVSEFVTLDGVMEDPGGSEKTARGGWAFQYDRGAEGDKFKLDEVMAADALLLGRVTYEGFAKAWPGLPGDFADKMNGMPKYVVSSTMKNGEWNNSRVIEGNCIDEIVKLRATPRQELLVAGSGKLVHALIENALVDELRLMVYPVLLGSGKRLFEEGVVHIPMRLIEARSVGAGVLILVYQPGGKKAEGRPKGS